MQSKLQNCPTQKSMSSKGIAKINIIKKYGIKKAPPPFLSNKEKMPSLLIKLIKPLFSFNISVKCQTLLDKASS